MLATSNQVLRTPSPGRAPRTDARTHIADSVLDEGLILMLAEVVHAIPAD